MLFQGCRLEVGGLLGGPSGGGDGSWEVKREIGFGYRRIDSLS